jgi:putative transposase
LDEQRLTEAIVELASRYGRYGYRRIWALLQADGWHVNLKRVHRIWRREGLKVPSKQPKRGRLWLNDGSCIRLRPTHKGHVWACDFIHDRTRNGRALKMLVVVDEFSRECLAIRVDRRLRSTDVIAVLSDQFILRGVPDHVRSDNGPEFVATAVRDWIAAVGARTAYVEPGSPWENGYCESFNAKLRDELLDGEIFYSLAEAKIVIEAWRRHYNTKRPHSSLGYGPAGSRGRAMAGFATRSRYAGHASRSAKTRHALRLQPDHPIGAGHRYAEPVFWRGAAELVPAERTHPTRLTRPVNFGVLGSNRAAFKRSQPAEARRRRCASGPERRIWPYTTTGFLSRLISLSTL